MDYSMHSLHDGLAEIHKFCEQNHLYGKVCYKINLICEELIVNLIRHGKATSYSLSLSQKESSTEISIRYDGEKFDPTIVPKQKQESVEKMAYGGLGLMLINSIASTIEYKYNKKQSLNVIKIIL